MAKKESRFKLDKGEKRSFDMSKGGKMTFDLTKDEPTPVAPVEESPQPGPEPGWKKKWIVIGVIVAVIAVLVWWFMSRPNSNAQKEDVKEKTEEVDDASDLDDKTDTSVSTGNSPEAPADVNAQENAESPTVQANEPPAQTQNQGASTLSAPGVTATQQATAQPSPSSAEQPAGSSVVSNDVDIEAAKVIRGDYGVGRQRMNTLGHMYRPVQTRVNEMIRQGR